MASAPDTESRETRQKEALAALALLLTNTKRRYDLPALVAAHKIRPRKFGRIQPTNALKSDLGAPYFDIVRAFEAQADGLMRAYVSSGGNAELFGQAIARAEAAITPIVTAAGSRFQQAADIIERWHRSTWVQRVKASTGLDVSFLTAAQDVSAAVSSTVAWNKQLAADVLRQMAHRVANDMIAGAAADVPDTEIAGKIAEAVSKAKKRAAAIADDQVDKLSRAMDRQRREAAGVTQFLWLHTPQKHPRDWHLARNGNVFTAADIPLDDRAGVPVGCKCYELPLLQ